jgi:hypothetical protein
VGGLEESMSSREVSRLRETEGGQRPRLGSRLRTAKAAHHPASRSVGGTSPFTALRGYGARGGHNVSFCCSNSSRPARGGRAVGEIARAHQRGKGKNH